ncbi:hypothetical protein RWE15_18570 [Virgibacillus halophilus]|uniref:Uncharacterized protein n=1 Tax=Tigheibacillus halophilus TaxID=361280 RepID=A0ABU5C9J6_9BACI|nr:hypothetical protein [Virgibacillus halophilus]
MEQENVAKEKRYLDEQQSYLETQLQDLQAELLSRDKRAALEQEQKSLSGVWRPGDDCSRFRSEGI